MDHVAVAADVLERIEGWDAELACLHERFADSFLRSEPRLRALRYMWGLLALLERKNGWTLAEEAGEAVPDGMQRLLNDAVWDADEVRDRLREYVAVLRSNQAFPRFVRSPFGSIRMRSMRSAKRRVSPIA